MDAASSIYRVLRCSRCPSATEYFCLSCICDMCSKCKNGHVMDLKTIDHNMVIYSTKVNSISKREACLKHPQDVYGMYCQTCELPVCYHCKNHRTHPWVDIRKVFETKRKELKSTIENVRNEALLNRTAFLTEIKYDIKTRNIEFPGYHSAMLERAQRLKDSIDNMLAGFDFKHRCLKQKHTMIMFLDRNESYEHVHEYSSNNPLQFLTKKSYFQQIIDSPHTIHHSQIVMANSVIKENVMKSLIKIKIIKRENRHLGNERLLSLLSSPDLHQHFTVVGARNCRHISCVGSDKAWVSDEKKNIILTNTIGETKHIIPFRDLGLPHGSHSINSKGNLIYINMSDMVKKLTKDCKRSESFIKTTDVSWRLRCVYSSQISGEILAGMWSEKTSPRSGKITRYSQTGILVDTIHYAKTEQKLHRKPLFITENTNQDIIVSDMSGAVIVTDLKGIHRFSYKGHRPGTEIEPAGICTDALSHILLCDERTNTVQMLDKDGQFLSYLLIRPEGLFKPYSLSYDANTHRLWVGSIYKNKVFVYRYITRQNSPEGNW